MHKILIASGVILAVILTTTILVFSFQPESEADGAEEPQQSMEKLLEGQYDLGRYKTAEKSVVARNEGYTYQTEQAIALITNEYESENNTEGGRNLQLEFGVEVEVFNWSDDPLNFYLHEAYILTDNGRYNVTVDYNPYVEVPPDYEDAAELWFHIDGETLNDLEEITLVLPPAKNEYGGEQTLVDTIELEITLIEEYDE